MLSFFLSQQTVGFTQEKKEIDTFELDETVITATKTETSLKDVPQDVNIITSKEIAQTNAQTIGDLMKYIPGLNVSMSDDAPGASTWQSTLRGMSIDDGYGLVLIDGQRVKGRGMGEYGNGLNQIPVEMIERIEIVKGPGSVLYGSDAMTGVINIITKSVSNAEKFNMYANYGSQETAREGFTYSNRVKNVGFRTSGCMERTKINGYESRYLNNRFNYKEGNVSYTLDVDLNHLETTSQVERRIKFGPEVNFDLGNGSRLITKGYWYNWDFLHSSRDGYIRYAQGETQYTRLITEKQKLTGGMEFLREGMDYIFVASEKDKTKWPRLEKNIDTWSAYAQDEWSPVSKAFIVFGARFDHHSSFGGVVSPRISGLLDVTSVTRLRASVGRSFKSPTIRQLYYPVPFLHSSTDYNISNPDLKPEYGMGYTVSLEHTFSKSLFSNVMFYRNDIKDMVNFYDTGTKIDGIPVWGYENVTKALTQGVECELKFQILSCLSGIVSIDYTDTENKDTGKRIRYVPDHSEGIQLNYNNSKYGFNVEWGTKFIGSLYTDAAITKKQKAFTLAEAKISKTITQKISISFEGDNLFDTDYGTSTTTRMERSYFVKFNLNN